MKPGQDLGKVRSKYLHMLKNNASADLNLKPSYLQKKPWIKVKINKQAIRS